MFMQQNVHKTKFKPSIDRTCLLLSKNLGFLLHFMSPKDMKDCILTLEQKAGRLFTEEKCKQYSYQKSSLLKQ